MLFSKVTVKELNDHYKNLKDSDLILDVRSAEEFRDGHIPKSRHIPHTDAHDHLDELSKYSRIFIICHSGGRATMAAGMLGHLGLKGLHCVTSGGVDDWAEAGFPIEK